MMAFRLIKSADDGSPSWAIARIKVMVTTGVCRMKVTTTPACLGFLFVHFLQLPEGFYLESVHGRTPVGLLQDKGDLKSESCS